MARGVKLTKAEFNDIKIYLSAGQTRGQSAKRFDRSRQTVTRVNRCADWSEYVKSKKAFHQQIKAKKINGAGTKYKVADNEQQPVFPEFDAETHVIEPLGGMTYKQFGTMLKKYDKLIKQQDEIIFALKAILNQLIFMAQRKVVKDNDKPKKWWF